MSHIINREKPVLCLSLTHIHESDTDPFVTESHSLILTSHVTIVRMSNDNTVHEMIADPSLDESWAFLDEEEALEQQQVSSAFTFQGHEYPMI